MGFVAHDRALFILRIIGIEGMMTISLTADTVGLYSLQSGLSMPLVAVPVRLDVPRHPPPQFPHGKMPPDRAATAPRQRASNDPHWLSDMS